MKVATQHNHDLLIKGTYRLASRYQIYPFNRLPEAFLSNSQAGDEPDGSIVEKDDMFGVVVDSVNKDMRSIDRETALLLLVLQTPGSLPDYLLNHWSLSIATDIKLLLSMDIIEIAFPSHGDSNQTSLHYLSGSKALQYLNENLNQKEKGQFDQASLDAIQHVCSQQASDPLHVASQLYNFNKAPVSRTLFTTLSCREDVKTYLGLEKNDLQSQDFHNNWHSNDATDGWISFHRKVSQSMASQSMASQSMDASNQQTFKLYLSPDLNVLTQLFFPVSQLLYLAGAQQFKVGHDAYGLQRADKWVAYFPNKELLSSAIQNIIEAVGDISGQQVPFAGSTDCSWLSWGSDPVQQASMSWRWLVCQEVGTAITDWKLQMTKQTKIPSADSNVDIEETLWPQIMARLEREGINPVTMEPNPLWRSGHGNSSIN